MRTPRISRIVFCLLLAWGLPALSATEQEAAGFVREGRFDQAAEAFQALVNQNPRSVRLRIELADNLARDRQWDRALAEYERVLKLEPNNVEALKGIGSVNRWRGHIAEARKAYRSARAAAPNDPGAVLEFAVTETQDHDFSAARALYDEAGRRWPQDPEVKQATYDFNRLANPRVYAYFENDLSFQTRMGGAAAPFSAREEIGYERQQELRYSYLTGDKIYQRDDNKLLYTHFFGFNHTLEIGLRNSKFSYEVPPVDFTAIDTFDEYRVRYAVPVTPEQVVGVRYTARPTTLVGGQTFVSQKIEPELISQWEPRFQTQLGVGWLRDLDPNATAVDQLTDRTLVRAGFQYIVNNRLDISARYVTNPDLDSTIDSTLIAEANYGLSPDGYSLLVRGRHDSYKTGDDQSSAYAGIRYTPTSNLWSEAGIKYVVRGPSSGFFPLVSVIWRF